MPGDPYWTLERASTALAGYVASAPLLLPASLRFSWRGCDYEMEAVESGKDVTIRITGVLGRVPFTSEDRRARDRILNILKSALESWPWCGLRLIGGEVQLCCEIRHDAPVSLNDLATAASCALLQIKPAVEFLEQDLLPAS